jgi:hypothetical protein
MFREYPPLRDVKSVSQAFELDEAEAFMEQQLRQSCERFKMPQADIDAYIRAWKSASHADSRIVVNPTMAQIQEFSNRYKIAIPKNIPREGWRSQIFAAAVPKPASDWSRQVPDVEIPTSGGRNSQQETPPRDEDDPRDHKQQKIKYTIWTPSQICALKFNPDDIIIENGYLEKGAPSVWCGPAGIGKSRLTLQLAFCCVFDRGFIGWNQRGGPKMAILADREWKPQAAIRSFGHEKGSYVAATSASRRENLHSCAGKRRRRLYAS